jgi:hypothetical protein
MPWHQEPKKDVASCEKPRVVASRHRTGDLRMGQPVRAESGHSLPKFIKQREATGGTETSKYPEEKKETSIPSVAASERGRAQT